MADVQDTDPTRTDPAAREPHGTDPADQTVSRAEYDKLLAESRKWESRAKENKDAAKRLAELEDASKTDAEKLDDATKRMEAAEAKLAAYEAEAQRAKDAAEVAEATGIPASLLTETDRKAMEAQAASILAFAQGQPVATVFKGDGKRPGPAPKDKKDIFFDFIESQM
jgi:hypothetical protein